MKLEVTLLTEVLYADLQRLAHRVHQRTGPASDTLCTTALVNEAYLKLSRHGGFRDHGHFLATAALAMRQVLITHARGRLTGKRGSGIAAVPLDLVEGFLAVPKERIVALDDALQDLEERHPRMVRGDKIFPSVKTLMLTGKEHGDFRDLSSISISICSATVRVGCPFRPKKGHLRTPKSKNFIIR